MIYIFLPSYQTVLFSLEQFRIDEITYVTYTPSIKEFAERVGIRVLYREEQTDLSIKGYKDYKKLCLEVIKGWEGREILSCFYTFDTWALFQLNILRKKNRVFFYNTDNLTKAGFDESTSRHLPVLNNSIPNLFNEKYRRVFIRQKLFNFITGFRIDLLEIYKNYFVLGLALKRCRKLFLPFPKRTEVAIFKENQITILEKFKLQNINVLFIDGGEEDVRVNNELFDVINKTLASVNLKMLVKAHPNFPLRQELRSYEQVDRLVPVELLQGIPRLVFGIYSFGLRGFSSNHPTISLINLVSFTSEDIKKSALQFVNDSDNILAPKSLEELKTLLHKFLT
jgi:hypothetical protein